MKLVHSCPIGPCTCTSPTGKQSFNHFLRQSNLGIRTVVSQFQAVCLCTIHSKRTWKYTCSSSFFSYIFHSLNFVSLAWLRQSTTSSHPWPSIATWPVASRFLVLVKPGKPVATRLVKPAIFIQVTPNDAIYPYVNRTKQYIVSVSTESQIKQGQMTYEIPSVKILQQLQMKQWLTTSSKLFMTIHVHHPSVLTPFPSPRDTYSCNIIQFRYVNIIHLK